MHKEGRLVWAVLIASHAIAFPTAGKYVVCVIASLVIYTV
jgi:hypothetical protein